MPGVLAFGTMAGAELTHESLEVAACARDAGARMRSRVSGALLGHGCEIAARGFATAGISELFVIDDTRLSPYLGDAHIAAAQAVIARCSPEFVVFPHTTETMEWVPRLAARMQGAVLSACRGITFDGETLIATKAISGGAVMADYTFHRPLKMVTLLPGCGASAQAAPPCPIVALPMPMVHSPVRVLEYVLEPAPGGPPLKSARVVVSGGIGMGSGANWTLIEQTAALLEAATGATRAAVELGWASSAQQVGFSGQKIRPELYMAIGISGALHHLAGISAAKTIVAINTDAQANIFRAARLGVVGDAMQVVPAFIERVRELRQSLRQNPKIDDD
jgi:electron transfer flavoprotein alpha subunit